jgi:hypothetical protein
MALANYSDLQASALDWMTRAGQTGQVVDWILLAEARLNREIGAVETDATITGVSGSRRIDISSLSMVHPIALFLAEVGNDEVFVTPKADGTFPYLHDTGRPTIWAIDGTNIDFDRELDAAYPFRLRYRQKFNLASSPTNWLLTNHPDVYLAATLMWGAGYNEDWSNGQVWKGILDSTIPDIKNAIAQSKRSVSTVDRGLVDIGRHYRRGWNGVL